MFSNQQRRKNILLLRDKKSSSSHERSPRNHTCRKQSPILVAHRMDKKASQPKKETVCKETTAGSSMNEQRKESAVRAYLATSTIHGLAKIGESKRWSLKLLWSIVVLTLWAFSVFNMWNLTAEFFQYRTYYSIQDHLNSTAKFPSVTICNANSYQKSKVGQLLTNVEERFQHFLNLSMEKGAVLDVLFTKGSSNFKNHKNLTLAKATQSSSDALFLDAFESWCRFGSFRGCSRSDFADYAYNTMSGYCKTFNPNGSFQQILAGPFGGLVLTLYLNQDDYLRLLPIDGGAGVLVAVHPKDVLPSTSSAWFGIQPGTQTLLSVEQSILFRQQKPYKSNCVNRNGNAVYPGGYEISNCIQSCHAIELYKKCGFSDPIVMDHLRKKEIKLPPKTNVSEDTSQCISKAYQELLTAELSCDCPLPCYEESFTLSSSSTRWPTEADMKYYQPVLSKILNKTGISKDFIYSNLLQLKVFFKRLGYKEVREVPAISPCSYIAGIGGSFGLFVGASFFSVLEFVTFVITIFFGNRQKNIVSAKLALKE